MKMFFRRGKFEEESSSEKFDGLNSINWTPSTVIEGDTFLVDSIYEITTILGRYDIFKFGTIKERDMYVIYKRTNDCATKQLITELLEKINNNQVDDITNNEDAMLYEAIHKVNYSANKNYEFYVEDTIFWDVFNNFIVVFGKENLKDLAIALEMEPSRPYANATSTPLRKYVLNDSFTKKIESL